MDFWDDEQLVKRFFDKVEKTDNCWNWAASKDVDGYGNFALTHNKTRRAHRISFEIYHKRNIITGMLIMHSCDNPKCVNPLHLSEGTPQDNMTDKVKKGRQAKGITSGKSKLTEQQVLEIREKYATEDYTLIQLGKEYNMAHSVIGYIINRKLWAHL